MRSVSMLSTDSIPNTSTIYSLFESNDSICFLEQTETDTFEICSPITVNLPYTKLNSNSDLIGDLLFTIIFMIVFAFIRLRGKDLFYNLLNVLIKRKKAEIILNEGISSNLVCYILSLFLSFSTLSVCLSFLSYQNFLTLHSLYFLGGLLLYHFVLLIIVRLLGWTFNAKNTADEVIVNLWTYHIIIGLLISPFVISIFFVQNFAVVPLLKIVVFSLTLLMIVKIIRWIEILFAHRVSILYMILYLCALEIMPLLVLYKVVV